MEPLGNYVYVAPGPGYNIRDNFARRPAQTKRQKQDMIPHFLLLTRVGGWGVGDYTSLNRALRPPTPLPLPPQGAYDAPLRIQKGAEELPFKMPLCSEISAPHHHRSRQAESSSHQTTVKLAWGFKVFRPET